MSIKLSDLIEPVIDLAEIAAAKILTLYRSEFTIQQKNDKTPLTEADLAAHKIIVDGLSKLTPEIPILSEEDTSIPYSTRKTWDVYWLIDPLDGTREFIKRNDEFTINIALIKNHLPVLGVIYTPVSGICFYATQGNGAFKLDKNTAPKSLSVRTASLNKIYVARSRSYFDNSLNIFLSNLQNYELTKMGSSLKSCLVAEGKIDIYPRLGPTSEWDTAAAQCIIEEAGGHLTTTDMKQLRYNTKDSLLNPHFLAFGDKNIDWTSFVNTPLK